MIKMVVFDMAGTTINENNLVYKTIQKALAEYNCEVDLPTVLSIAAGKEKRGAIRDVYLRVEGVAPPTALLDQIHQYFRDQLDMAYELESLSVFDGLSELLADLRARGVICIFNTGYTHTVASKILDKVGISIGSDIDDLITADMVSNSRPEPDMIQMAMDKWNCAPSEVIKVGDSCIDIEEGRNARVRYAIGITTGAQKREELLQAAPDAVIDRIEQILDYV
jgi:phosphonatase-like hydrolase